jgi:amino acid transporter
MTAGLVRVLTLRDLVLAQVLVVVGSNWFGAAAKLGSGGLVLWLCALLLFHLPLAVVVIALTRVQVEEGGPMHWVRRGFGERAGFLYGYTLLTFLLLIVSSQALAVVTGLAYAFSGHAGALASAPLLALAALAALAAVAALAWRGFGESRWLSNAAALGLLLVVALLAIRAFTGLWSRPLPAPNASLDLVFLATCIKTSVYGLAGLEFLAILAGEVRQPERDLPRSVALAAPLIGLIYLLGTTAVLVSVPAAEIDLVNPVAQVLARDGGAMLVLVLAVALLRDFAQFALLFAGATRLPLTLAWSGRLPPALGALDARGQPRLAIVVCAIVVALLLLLASSGGGRQAAFQILISAAGLLFGLSYLVLFALPLFVPARLGLARRPLLTLAAASGFALTLAFVLFSIVPIDETADFAGHALRAAIAVLVLLLPGLWLARRAHSKPLRSSTSNS